MPSNEYQEPIKLVSDKETETETDYLLKSEKNASRLLESIQRIKEGNTTQRNLIEND